VELIETSTFTKQIAALLSDEEYGEFQSRLAANPQLGAVIKGSGGIRKVRVAVGSRGKRGGARVVYYGAVRRDLILPVCLPQKRGCGSHSKTGFATWQSGQSGVRR
jgi:hypothetical protein